ncbi:hypothetical protein [Rubritepida flocculans]|uniref:hypothetical protein n=1 Tax=Rubritepida flocculans TaxID=182403 RepID=UPI0003FB8F37|nr:hypothetical protein [Rubritepida flocculans]
MTVAGGLLALALLAAGLACLVVAALGLYLAADAEVRARQRHASGVVAAGALMGLGGVVAAIMRVLGP